MLPFQSNSTRKFQTRVFSLNGHGKILLFKEDQHLFYRSGLLVTVRPLQIPSLFPLIDLFTHPSQLSLRVPMFKLNNFDSYLAIFILDTDLSDCPKKDYDPFLKSSLKFHGQQLDLLRKNISLKDYESRILSNKQLLDFSFGKVARSLKKFGYSLEFKKEIDIFRNVVFSNNKIKKLDYKRDSIIPPCEIVLGKTISNKEIGVNSHTLFLTGQKEFRRSIILTLINHFAQQDDYHIIIFDFGLLPTLGKNHYRTFLFDNIFLDPFSFTDSLSPSQHALFISHLSFISKNILHLNDRQIGILEDKLSSYLQQEKIYSWNSFLSFVQDEVTEETLSGTSNVGSFLDDASTGDFTSILKSVDTPSRSTDFESLINKLRYLDYLFAKADRTSLPDILFKTHLDVFSISTTPDLKSLAFYLFNLFYSLTNGNYKDFKFFFLDIDSMLFDKFNDFDISWLHPDLKNSLFDSSDIFTSKKIFTILDTRVYCSYIPNAPTSLLSKNTKECVDKLQFLHDYFILESPTLQRPEFFKLIPPEKEKSFDLPNIELFKPLSKILFSKSTEFFYRQLYALFDVDYKLLSQLIKNQYIRKHKKSYVLTEKADFLRKTIIELLSYQPPLTLEENDLLIKFSDPVAYNVFFRNEFPFTGNIGLLCTRLLANQFIHNQINSFLLFQFLSFKKQLISDKQLLYYLIVALQQPTNPITYTDSNESQTIVKNFNDIDNEKAPNDSKIEIMRDYFSNIKSVLEENDIQPKDVDQIESNNMSPIAHSKDVQDIIDDINKRINDALPDKHISFPQYPIFFVMKFLNSNTNELINNDIEKLINTTG